MDSTGYDVTQSNEKETSDCYDEDKIREEQCAKDDESVSMSSNLLAFLICGDCAQHPDKVSDCSDTLCKNEECTSSVIDDDGLSASSSLKIASLSSIDIGDDVVDPHKENVNDTSYENDLEEKVYSVEFVASNQSTHGSISSTVAEVDKEVLSHSESTFCANEFGKKHNIDHNGSLPGPSNIKVSHSSVISTCGDVIDVDLGKSDYNSRNEVTEGYGDSSDDEHLFFDKADELHMSSSTSLQILHEVQSLLCTPPLSIDNIFTPHSSRPPCKTLSLEICQDEECPSTLEQDLSSPDLPEAKELWEEYAANRHSSPEYFLFPPFTLEQEEWIVQVDHPFKDYVLQCWQERWHCSMQGWLEDLVD